MQNIMGTNFQCISFGNEIWKSFDGETWMITIGHIKPTIEFVPFSTYCCYVEFQKKKAQSPIVSMGG